MGSLSRLLSWLLFLNSKGSKEDEPGNYGRAASGSVQTRVGFGRLLELSSRLQHQSANATPLLQTWA